MMFSTQFHMRCWFYRFCPYCFGIFLWITILVRRLIRFCPPCSYAVSRRMVFDRKEHEWLQSDHKTCVRSRSLLSECTKPRGSMLSAPTASDRLTKPKIYQATNRNSSSISNTELEHASPSHEHNKKRAGSYTSQKDEHSA